MKYCNSGNGSILVFMENTIVLTDMPHLLSAGFFGLLLQMPEREGRA